MFKRYYGIDFSSDYEIHHIDLNHDNNDIANLMLLPKALHHKYHIYMNATSHMGKKPYERCFDARIFGNVISKNSYEIDMIRGLFEVLSECSVWYDYKLYLDDKIPNIHGITLD
jgi:hypothetical protein